jgi:hypothetical protein
MKGKIKNLFKFIGRAWSGNEHGKIGIFAAIFGIFMFVGLFYSDASIQRFVVNVWKLQDAYEQRDSEQDTLNKLEKHIQLLKENSPDYIQELGLKYLNVGDSKLKVLKF